MFNSRLIILSLVLTLHSVELAAPMDKSCQQLKTTKRADDCCKIPDFLTEGDEPMVNRCFVQQNKTKDEDEAFKCVAECVLKDLGAFKNGALDKESTRKLLVGRISNDTNFKPIVGGIFDKCFGQIPTEAKAKQNSTCNAGPTFLLDCVEQGLFENCPSAVWDKSDGCIELKSKLAQGCPYSAISN